MNPLKAQRPKKKHFNYNKKKGDNFSGVSCRISRPNALFCPFQTHSCFCRAETEIPGWGGRGGGHVGTDRRGGLRRSSLLWWDPPNPPLLRPGVGSELRPPPLGAAADGTFGAGALSAADPSAVRVGAAPAALNAEPTRGRGALRRVWGGSRPPQPPPPPHPPEGHLRVIEERPIGPHPRPRAIPAQPNPVLHGAPIAQHEPLWKRTAVGHDGPPGPPHRPPPISPTPAGSPRRPIALRGTDRSAAPHPSLPRPPRSRSTAAQPRSHRWGSPGGGGRLWGRGGMGGVSGLEGSRRSCTGGPKAMLSPIMALRTSWGGRGPSRMGPH